MLFSEAYGLYLTPDQAHVDPLPLPCLPVSSYRASFTVLPEQRRSCKSRLFREQMQLRSSPLVAASQHCGL